MGVFFVCRIVYWNEFSFTLLNLFMGPPGVLVLSIKVMILGYDYISMPMDEEHIFKLN